MNRDRSEDKNSVSFITVITILAMLCEITVINSSVAV